MPEKITVLTLDLLAERATRVRAINRRTDVTGMTRPAREPEKRAVLEQLNGLGPFSEGSQPRPTSLPARRRGA